MLILFVICWNLCCFSTLYAMNQNVILFLHAFRKSVGISLLSLPFANKAPDFVLFEIYPLDSCIRRIDVLSWRKEYNWPLFNEFLFLGQVRPKAKLCLNRLSYRASTGCSSHFPCFEESFFFFFLLNIFAFLHLYLQVRISSSKRFLLRLELSSSEHKQGLQALQKCTHREVLRLWLVQVKTFKIYRSHSLLVYLDRYYYFLKILYLLFWDFHAFSPQGRSCPIHENRVASSRHIQSDSVCHFGKIVEFKMLIMLVEAIRLKGWIIRWFLLCSLLFSVGCIFYRLLREKECRKEPLLESSRQMIIVHGTKVFEVIKWGSKKYVHFYGGYQ